MKFLKNINILQIKAFLKKLFGENLKNLYINIYLKYKDSKFILMINFAQHIKIRYLYFNKKQFILIKDLTKRHKRIIIWLRNAFIYSKRFKKDKHH